ncbi:MAG: glycosyltransferase N-terminal domain-containing protein, partial [Chlamydiota bacterium]
VEGDLWLNFLQAAKEYGAKILLINGRLSDRSFKRYSYFKGYSKWVFSKLDYCLLQNENYLNLFQRLGIAPSKLAVTGNIKFDIPFQLLSESALKDLKKALGITSFDKVLTIGSTHKGEERLLLNLLGPLLEQNSSLKILLAPRHPERFLEVEKELIQSKVSFCKWSTHLSSPCKERIILIDTMGLLRQCYEVSHVAIVGGSFVNIGGHNLLEPLEYGVPVIFGPYIHKQKELADLMELSKVGFKIELDQLAETVLNLIDLDTVADKAKAFLQAHHGAALRSWEVAQKLLKEIT